MSKRLFIGNLSFNVSETELQKAFEPFQPTGVEIPRRWVRRTDRDDRPKGFGFVEVPDSTAQAAIRAMDGKVLDGRPIDVAEAKPKPDLFPPTRFGGGNFGGGGRRFRR